MAMTPLWIVLEQPFHPLLLLLWGMMSQSSVIQSHSQLLHWHPTCTGGFQGRWRIFFKVEKKFVPNTNRLVSSRKSIFSFGRDA